MAEDIPFFLDFLALCEKIADAGSVEYAKVNTHKVIGAKKVFIDPRYNIVLEKVEVRVNIKYVRLLAEGDSLYTREEAAALQSAQDDAKLVPYIYLSAGVS